MIDRINIKELIKPSIELYKLEANFERSSNVGTPHGYNTAVLGQLYPYIVMNGLTLSMQQILYMEIDCMGFLPKMRLNMRIYEAKPNYLLNHFPRAGDIISVFIRSPNDDIRPIRNDYQVVTVDYLGGEGISDGGESFISITARLFIPFIYNQKTFAIEGTSYDVMMKLAKELELGFASNIDATDDSMRWMYIGNYEQFIQNIANHSWKDDNSFFTAFIDFTYHLNFININQQITNDLDGQAGPVSNIDIRNPSENTTFAKTLDLFKLTNNFDSMPFNNFVAKYNLINNSSILSYKEGVIKDYTFYDYTIMQDTHGRLDALRTDDMPDRLRSISDNLGTLAQTNLEWLGIQYSLPNGNVHRHYNYSVLHNNFNNTEMDKMILQAYLRTPNFFVHKGQRLFMEIFSYADKYDYLSSPETRVTMDGGVIGAINTFLTDFYYVKGHKIIYDPSHQMAFSQEIYLTKRDWALSNLRA